MRLSFLFFFFGLFHAAFAQCRLTVNCPDCTGSNSSLFSKGYTDSTAVFHAADSLFSDFQKRGFWACSIDSLQRVSKGVYTEFHAVFHAGSKYKGILLKNTNTDTNIDTLVLENIGYQDFLYRKNDYFDTKKLNLLKEKLVRWGETHGYPFCTVFLQNVAVDYPLKGEITAEIAWKKGKFFTFDTLQIDGKARVSNRFLAQYLGIKRGMIYDESRIEKVRARLAELPFLEETQANLTEFSGKKARLHLFLTRKRASQFDVLIGFLPDAKKENTLLVTGNADIAFQNLFGGGEQFTLTWLQARPESPEGKIALNIPYLFRLPVGATGNFELYKRDSSYLETRAELGAQYRLEGNDAFRIFWTNAATNLIKPDTNTIKQTRTLPNVLDMQTNGFGIAYTQERLDYRFNPRKGYRVGVKVSGNVKTVTMNPQISDLRDENDPDFSYSTLYDTVSRQSYQYRVALQAAYYQPFGKRTTLKIGVDGGYIGATAPLLRNEQYRIGGAKRLRGFNEESLFASFYGIATLEYRFIIAQNSYLFTFADQAYLEDNSRYTHLADWPLGVGAGFSFETKAGIFALTIAFGKQVQQTIDFNAAKVHFGYVNLF
ncbi:MAG: hypothetical protein RI894_867 [Bacteroidota bacterium]|jgi:outer membrane protein assembly factor BamA